MRVKLIDEALKRLGKDAKLPDLQRALIRGGSNVTLSALINAQERGNKSLKFEVLCALVKVAFDGDWSEAGKYIEEEFSGARNDSKKKTKN
jgi:hypothetical protein